MFKILAAVLLVSVLACAGNQAETSRQEDAPSAAAVPAVVAPQTTPHETYPFVGDAKVSRTLFDNGLRLLVVESHASPTVAYQTWFRVGGRDEPPGRTGLAHLFEHLMFRRTATLADGEFDRILEANGAEGVDALADRDFTAYMQQLPADQLERIVKLEAERMVSLVVDERAFRSELQVLRDEQHYREAHVPAGVMEQALFALAFTTSAYRRPVAGATQDLERLTVADARTFYQTWYRPDHATIVIVGDIDVEQARTLVRTHYGGLARGASAPAETAVEPPQSGPRRGELSLDIPAGKLMMGFHVPGMVGDETPALELLGALLTGDRHARLHRALVEPGIASSVEARRAGDGGPTLFIISAAMRPGRTAARAESVIVAELVRMAGEPVPAVELARAMDRADAEYYTGLTTPMAMARFLGRYESIAGDFRIGMDLHARVRALSAADVQAVARKYLGPSQRNVITAVPR